MRWSVSLRNPRISESFVTIEVSTVSVHRSSGYYKASAGTQRGGRGESKMTSTTTEDEGPAIGIPSVLIPDSA